MRRWPGRETPARRWSLPTSPYASIRRKTGPQTPFLIVCRRPELVLPEDMKQLVRHARKLVLQFAEVLVTRKMLTGILERIIQLRLTPG